MQYLFTRHDIGATMSPDVEYGMVMMDFVFYSTLDSQVAERRHEKCEKKTEGSVIKTRGKGNTTSPLFSCLVMSFLLAT